MISYLFDERHFPWPRSTNHVETGASVPWSVARRGDCPPLTTSIILEL
jgi:hypothetical protein